MVRNIIVQAGGRGSRLNKLTDNKPKALVPVDNLPMIFHLFRAYPDCRFVIIGDYKIDVLEKYLETFADCDYVVVNSSGGTGTCSGVGNALDHVAPGDPFLLIWCDLVLPTKHEIPEGSSNVIGLSGGFECRWSYSDGLFYEAPSTANGVAGYFVFKDKAEIQDVPNEGEFVRWLQQRGYVFDEEITLDSTHEYGTLDAWLSLPKSICRPFNRIEFVDDEVRKYPVDRQGEELAEKEQLWYRTVADQGFGFIPKVYSFEPLCLERVKGKNVYETGSYSIQEKKKILSSIINDLKELHCWRSEPVEVASYMEAYCGKTKARLERVESLVPFAKDPVLTICNKRCKNVLSRWGEVEALVKSYIPKDFVFIHGDCTFSNTLITDALAPVFIDPRGYFGTTELYGDPAYDWVKLYYSLYSNYDQFNLKRFELSISQDSVDVEVESNGWESMEGEFFRLLSGEVSRKQMKLFLALTWLSLTTYAWEDYDSICAAYYIGTYYLKEALSCLA